MESHLVSGGVFLPVPPDESCMYRYSMYSSKFKPDCSKAQYSSFYNPNLNHGQDTRANRTRHTSSSTHTITRKTATHERNPGTHLTFTHTVIHTHLPPHSLTPQPPPRASAPARGTIACAISTDLSASASARCLPCCCTCRSRPTSLASSISVRSPIERVDKFLR